MAGDLDEAQDPVFSIAPRELGFRLKDEFNSKINRPGQNGLNDAALKIFTSANKLLHFQQNQKEYNDMTPEQRRWVLRSTLVFVGVPLLPIDYLNKNNKDAVAIQVAGSVTIANTGKSPIRPGDLVLWDLPVWDVNNPGGSKDPKDVHMNRKRNRTALKGEPYMKELFATVPLEHAVNTLGILSDQSSDSFRGFAHFLMSNSQAVFKRDKNLGYINALKDAVIKAPTQQNLSDYTQAILVAYHDLQSRIIGVALSGALPGQQFGACKLRAQPST